MFGRENDNFNFENDCFRFMGQDPKDHFGPPFFGPPPPPFGAFPPFPGMHHKPPLPIGREAFQEIRDYMLLIIISEYPEGITGYQLQDTYKFPRGTLIRTLQDLEEKKYLKTRDEIIEGRANKFYLMTETGMRYLDELKLKWASIFGMLAEFNPSLGLQSFLFEKIAEFESLDDAIDFFRGIRLWMKGMLQNFKKRMVEFENSMNYISKIIVEIENMDFLNKEKIKSEIEEILKKMEEY